MLRDSELEALRRGDLELTALECTLRRKREAATLYSGPGLLTQTADRTVAFTIFLPGASPDFISDSRAAGELLEDEDYYEATFNDVCGRAWTADYVLPHFEFDAKGRGCTVSGLVWELIERAVLVGLRRQRAELTIEIFREVNVPANSATAIERTSGSYTYRHHELNLAVVDVGDLHFELSLGTHATTVRCSGRADLLPSKLELRIIEALQFVAGHRVTAAVTRLVSANEEHTSIASKGLRLESGRGLPPVAGNLTTSSPAVWSMFALYLVFALRSASEDMHAVSAAWDGILAAESASIDTQALVLSVAVESILKELDPAALTPSALQAAQQGLKKWIATGLKLLGEAGMPPDLLERFRQQLSNMLGRRAVDKLYDLAGAGAINKALIARWKSLRDASAHGKRGSTAEMAKTLYNRDATLVLLYQIIFWAIGYEGHFTDYSVVGWPARHYPKDLNDTSSLGNA
jgi:hypothetical protein